MVFSYAASAITLALATAEPDASDWVTFIRDTVLRLGEVYAWPAIVVGILIAFREDISRLIKVLLRRVAYAQALKMGPYEDQLPENIREALTQEFGFALKSIASPKSVSISETVHASDDVGAELVSGKEARTIRDVIVRSMARASAKTYRVWRSATKSGFPDDKMALLKWVHVVGAPMVVRSYEVFTALAEELKIPVPDEQSFRNQVSAYDRDHPADV